MITFVVLWPSAALAELFLVNTIAADCDNNPAKVVATPLLEQLSEARLQLQQAD